MITNWDIVSRLDPQDKSRRYTLVTDGTENDARLIAKKLEGYAQPAQPAQLPFVYAFELPADLDDDTLDKIRTAVKEAVAQSEQVNRLVPGGVLGDPLFQSPVNPPDKEFGTLQPEDSFFKPSQPAAEPATPPQADLPDAQQPPIHGNPSSAAKEKSGEITISDKDMLIKDMEGTMLGQMPLEDIFSAETKYDMFLDLDNQTLNKNSQFQREQKINNLADGKDSLEETFNVFEQKIKDQTCIIDLEDLNTITDRLSKKNTDFLKHSPAVQATPQGKELPQPAAETDAAHPAEHPSAPQGSVVPPAAPAQPLAEAPSATAEGTAPEIPHLAPQAPGPELADDGVEDPFEQIEKTVRGGIPPHDQPADAPSAPVPPSAAEKAPAPAPAEDDEPLNLGPSPEEASVNSWAMEHTAPGELPEEVALTNTVPPTQYAQRTISISQDGDDLPEITLRGQQIDALDKTFNLETTLNTEVMKRQYEKSFHDEPAPAPQKPAAPRPPAPARPVPAAPKPAETHSDGGHPSEATHFSTVQSGESIMEENQEPKTTFRIRRKIEAPTQPTIPPAPPAPAAPHAPQAPASAPAQPHPAQQPPVQRPPVQQPAQPKPALANTILEKTKTIDHSIEIPLSELKKHNWPLEVPLVPTYTLENMVMSVNRFAHATAISVIENPGKLYNPLVLHGATGTGKTHFLNAMAYAFSKKYGQENIFMTNGVRLSRGIQRYVMEGNIEKFEKFMDTVKVLLIDDIHLLAINEQNRVYISKLLNKFLRDQKQIVITSKYPPESLVKLEELIKFKLDSGWISELKPARGATHFRIVKKMLLDNGVDLNDAQITKFFGGPHMTLGTVTRSIRRLKVLENLIFPHLPEADRSQAKIFEKLLATQGEDASSAILSHDPDSVSAITNMGNGEWGRIGFFYPQNSSHMMNWMVYALQQRAKELGIQGGFEIAVRSSYATENIISSAFKIANLCDNKKLKGAVILGPALNTCDPSVRENFYDILTHMLEIMLIRCGIINYEDVKSPSTYVKVLSELLR